MSISVVHIVRQYSPSVGGMEDVVQNISRQQRDHHDQRPKIITLNRLFKNSTELLPREAVVNGVGVVRLPFHGTSRYPLCPQVLQHVADADVVHVHGIDFFFDYMAFTKLLHRRPLVASTHGGFFHTSFASTLKKIYFNSITRASSMIYDKIVATSENDGEIFKKIVKPSALTVIENGVNVEKYSNQASATLSQTLIYFGRWSVNKGLLETLALFKELVARQAGWKLIIAGREYDHTAAEFHRWVAQHNLAGSVQIVPNPSDLKLAELIGQSSYFICTSRHEGFGIAPVEAMSAGLIPLLSDIPPFRHLVSQSKIGLLVNTKNIRDSVEALVKMHAAGRSDYALRRNQAQQFAERYNWRQIADKYADIYTRLAGRKFHYSR
ncbi:glycosyltransferase family 4 protein [Glaciimonas immobilis]|uniref:Alpha-1,3-mannosyltransferase n=1 Tax=Glaciimonas immobilis TaxID=728004 RepID=A0A840RQM5_9BURK|nr:glycosyltransferase family 4 protein [Glaciimonas immobilis]KAF3998021.1 glycosyltransferase family 4 protein [Glaciimonas immobilis]MBB5199296.1 alpha-1,3-mannosyltransferase [Glaciimonas immobilis]